MTLAEFRELQREVVRWREARGGPRRGWTPALACCRVSQSVVVSQEFDFRQASLFDCKTHFNQGSLVMEQGAGRFRVSYRARNPGKGS